MLCKFFLNFLWALPFIRTTIFFYDVLYFAFLYAAVVAAAAAVALLLLFPLQLILLQWAAKLLHFY